MCASGPGVRDREDVIGARMTHTESEAVEIAGRSASRQQTACENHELFGSSGAVRWVRVSVGTTKGENGTHNVVCQAS